LAGSRRTICALTSAGLRASGSWVRWLLQPASTSNAVMLHDQSMGLHVAPGRSFNRLTITTNGMAQAMTVA